MADKRCNYIAFSLQKLITSSKCSYYYYGNCIGIPLYFGDHKLFSEGRPEFAGGIRIGSNQATHSNSRRSWK
jgi:hypothetical protein